jgi:hypothetical protein
VHSRLFNLSALRTALEQIALRGASFNEADSHTHCQDHLTSLHFQSCLVVQLVICNVNIRCTVDLCETSFLFSARVVLKQL